MNDKVIHLPQTDATGLSENWLFKHCGEMHWDYLCAAMGVSTRQSTLGVTMGPRAEKE